MSDTFFVGFAQTFIRSCERLELLSEEDAQVLTREGQTTPETRRAEKVCMLLSLNNSFFSLFRNIHASF
jgi:hypothetical protein